MSMSHNRIRPAAVAGMFYPADPVQLQADIHNYLKQVTATTTQSPRALIAPHAGYVYSGPIAASAYKQLLPVASEIRQVVLLGPSHRVAFRGIATPEADFFATPLGNIKINQTRCHELEQLPFVIPSEVAHSQEHSLEVHLPFLQSVLKDFELIPLVVGDCNQDDVCQLLDQLWDDKQTLIVISSDLSHYHDYQTATRLDRTTSDHIEHLEPEKIHYEDACGRNPLNGLLALARKKHLSIETVDLRNSGDTAGDKNRVVGYGAYVVH